MRPLTLFLILFSPFLVIVFKFTTHITPPSHLPYGLLYDAYDCVTNGQLCIKNSPHIYPDVYKNKIQYVYNFWLPWTLYTCSLTGYPVYRKLFPSFSTSCRLRLLHWLTRIWFAWEYYSRLASSASKFNDSFPICHGRSVRFSHKNRHHTTPVNFVHSVALLITLAIGTVCNSGNLLTI